MRKRITILTICAALLASVILISGRSNKGNAEKEKAFNDLMNDWKITFLTPYRVLHFEEKSFRGSGKALVKFQLELPKEPTSFRLARSKDPRFTEKDIVLGDDKSGLFPITTSPESKRTILWSIKSELLPTSRKLAWWTAGTNSTLYSGFMNSDGKDEHIQFCIIEGKNKELVLVESLSRRGLKK